MQMENLHIRVSGGRLENVWLVRPWLSILEIVAATPKTSPVASTSLRSGYILVLGFAIMITIEKYQH
jgi:hypothetical protein